MNEAARERLGAPGWLTFWTSSRSISSRTGACSPNALRWSVKLRLSCVCSHCVHTEIEPSARAPHNAASAQLSSGPQPTPGSAHAQTNGLTLSSLPCSGCLGARSAASERVPYRMASCSPSADEVVAIDVDAALDSCAREGTSASEGSCRDRRVSCCDASGMSHESIPCCVWVGVSLNERELDCRSRPWPWLQLLAPISSSVERASEG